MKVRVLRRQCGWRSLLIGTLGLLAQAATAAELPSFHRGFNTFPWLYRATTVGGDPQRFDYARLLPYYQRFTPEGFATLHAAGADVIRIPLEPTPLMVAGANERPLAIRAVLTAARRVTATGMTAIVDLHPHEGVKGWGSADIIGSPALWDSYVAAVSDLAAAMVASGDRRLMLELMNEPGGGYGGHEGRYWIYLQPQLLAAVRRVAPDLPVVVSGDRGGGIEGLLRLDPSKIDDPAVVYSFHYYDPMVVTHQGASWTSQPYRRYLQDVGFPPDPANEPAVLAAFQQRVRAATPPPADAAKVIADGSAALASYFASEQGPARMRADFARVTGWARSNSIPAKRILMGEFGVLRPGASDAIAIDWTRNVRSAAESAGFAWAYWNYAPFDENGSGFSVLRMHGPSPNMLDGALLSAGLGLKAP